MAKIPNRKFDYKLNIFLGFLFLAGGVVYLRLSMASGVNSALIKAIASFVLAAAWFCFAFYNYKKSKNL